MYRMNLLDGVAVAQLKILPQTRIITGTHNLLNFYISKNWKTIIFQM